MINIKYKEDCVGCNACVQRCPVECISMHSDEQGFLYPKVDEEKCINCGLCEKVCPVINQAEPCKPLHTYAAWNTDDSIRMSSSSGGTFYALAEYILSKGGVVFGAKFNDQWEVVHDYADTIEGVKAFQGSKYVQSRIGDNYKIAETFLKEGRLVLFTGTPCQISGLRLFLRKDYGDQLILVDVVCHGVPSPMIWKDYLRSIMRPEGAEAGKNSVSLSLNTMPAIAGISFRDKRIGWEKYGFAVRAAATVGSGKNTVSQSAISPDAESEILFEPLDKNLYMQGFLKDLYLRPSCYACPSKCGKSHSDITLADFWGIKRHHPLLHSDRGVSLVLANSDLSEVILGSLNIDRFETSYEDALSGNPALEKSAGRPKLYVKFWKLYDKNGVNAISRILKNSKPSVISKFVRRMKRVIKKFGRI